MKGFDAGYFDVIVIGAGHAGCEAALAAARMGVSTLVLTMSLDSIGMMPCNPSVGGTGKGHLVREIDALGGEMGRVADRTTLQSKLLNSSKGPAVHSLRAQIDKRAYHIEMKKVLENQENLVLRQAEVVDLIIEYELKFEHRTPQEDKSTYEAESAYQSNFPHEDKSAYENQSAHEDKPLYGNEAGRRPDSAYEAVIRGAVTSTGARFFAKKVIIATGTYLGSTIYIGDAHLKCGPNALSASYALPDSLKKWGFELRRFKTGTPARLDRRTLDFNKMEVQWGDEHPLPFSFETDPFRFDELPCYLTYTNLDTHKIILSNLHKSGLFTGEIAGTGARYCPSVETKITRFVDKERHQVFIEPEGRDTNEMYVQGMSTSMSEDVQIEFMQTIPGLEHCRIMRPAYAIEYECIDPQLLKMTLEHRKISGLYSAGQFNGTSGYEEAAAQGLIAGINAALSVQGKEPFILDRSEAYIGVLIDDLVTKGIDEPYRMMTSKAEYRLVLRQDNADLRLTEKGFRIGLVQADRYERFLRFQNALNREWQRIRTTKFRQEKVNPLFEKYGLLPVTQSQYLYDLLKKGEFHYRNLEELDVDRPQLPQRVTDSVEIMVKYEGYIEKQMKQIEAFRSSEDRLIPEGIDYRTVGGLRLEAVEKLDRVRPISIGQATRIPGVSPSDVAVLMVYLEVLRRGGSVLGVDRRHTGGKDSEISVENSTEAQHSLSVSDAHTAQQN